MKIAVKIALFMLALALMVVPAIACEKPTPPPALPPPAPALKKITLTDAPMVLDLLPLLPSTFEKIDAASEGMSNKDMGLGPKASEVELFFSEKPYQMIYGFLMITESRLERTAADAIFKDEQQIKSLIKENIMVGFADEGYELSNYDIETDITYPNIADFSVLGEGQITLYGISAGFGILYFRNNKVYVYLYSLNLSLEKQSLIPLAKEIAHRIGMFSQ